MRFTIGLFFAVGLSMLTGCSNNDNCSTKPVNGFSLNQQEYSNDYFDSLNNNEQIFLLQRLILFRYPSGYLENYSEISPEVAYKLINNPDLKYFNKILSDIDMNQIMYFSSIHSFFYVKGGGFVGFSIGNRKKNWGRFIYKGKLIEKGNLPKINLYAMYTLTNRSDNETKIPFWEADKIVVGIKVKKLMEILPKIISLTKINSLPENNYFFVVGNCGFIAFRISSEKGDKTITRIWAAYEDNKGKLIIRNEDSAHKATIK